MFDDLIAFAELCIAKESYKFALDAKVAFEELKNIERTKENPNGEFISTRIFRTNISNRVAIEVNKQEEAWHYPWDPTKRSSKLPHQMRIYVFKRVGDHAICIGGFGSTEFRIICKRARTKCCINESKGMKVSKEKVEKTSIKRKRRSEINVESTVEIKTTTKLRKQAQYVKSNDSHLREVDEFIFELKRKFGESINLKLLQEMKLTTSKDQLCVSTSLVQNDSERETSIASSNNDDVDDKDGFDIYDNFSYVDIDEERTGIDDDGNN